MQTVKCISYQDDLEVSVVYSDSSGIFEAGLRECNIGWSLVVPATPVTVDTL